MKVIAQTVSIECDCGGDMFDLRNGAYLADTTTEAMACDRCNKILNITALHRKTARIFYGGKS